MFATAQRGKQSALVYLMSLTLPLNSNYKICYFIIIMLLGTMHDSLNIIIVVRILLAGERTYV